MFGLWRWTLRAFTLQSTVAKRVNMAAKPPIIYNESDELYNMEGAGSNPRI